MSLIEIHGRLGNTALLYAIIMGVWGLWRYARKQGVDGSYWGALVVAEVLIVAQAGIGAYLWLSGTGSLVGRSIHILYGVVSTLIIPAAFFFTRGDEQRRAMLIYGVAFLFMVGIVLRAMTTV